jgi:glyoxylase-like metal-dependent hydrolase (beta-lactamase superfamily II)
MSILPGVAIGFEAVIALPYDAVPMATPIPYVRESEPVHGRVEWVSPLVRRIVAGNSSKFTYHGTGTYIVGRGEVAVIDVGPAIDAHVDAVLAALEPGERITHLPVTHTHTDHSPAASVMHERTGAPAYGFGPHGMVPPDDPSDVVVFGDDEADGKARVTSARSADELREGADTNFVPDVVLAHGDQVVGDGWTLRAVHTPGHTSNHLCFELVEERTLFTGDHVMGWSTTVIAPPDGNLAAYLASLRLLLDRDDLLYRPTHGAPVTEPHALVRAYLTHREERTEQIMAALAHGPATIATLVPVIYASVSKALWRPAAASMYAHILQLIETGDVVADEPGRCSTRFSLR